MKDEERLKKYPKGSKKIKEKKLNAVGEPGFVPEPEKGY